MERVIQLAKVRKIYSPGEYQVEALKGIDLTIEKGEYVAVMGASGSGKSTLMNIMGCLDTVTSGEFMLDNTNVNDLDKDDYACVRNHKIGFVFQGFHLLARTTALENVELPLFYGNHAKKSDYTIKAEAALKRVGLGDRMYHEPNQLSGGQQQRVAIARALVNEPALLLADEPTGNLDTATSLEIISIFQELNEAGMTVVLVTHEPDIAAYAKRIITLRDGFLISDHKVRGRRNASFDFGEFMKKNRISHISAKEAARS